MQCPVCKDVHLLIAERLGIEIDYCPRCRGVWLDRGELDKLIERAVQEETAAMRSFRAAPPRDRDWDWDEDRYREYRRKKKSWWREIFDFD